MIKLKKKKNISQISYINNLLHKFILLKMKINHKRITKEIAYLKKDLKINFFKI
jgi:ribosomal protein S18